MPLPGRNKRREGYELIEIDEDMPSSSLRDLSASLTTVESASEMEPLVRGISGQQYTCDPPVEYGLGDDSAEQRESTSAENRWEHIGNLDRFFTRLYEYHQRGGFVCIAAEYLFYLIQYFFIVFFATFLFQCIDYQVLFNDKNVTADGDPIIGKRRLQDAVVGNCVSTFHPVLTISLMFATGVWIYLFARAAYHLVYFFYETRSFYRRALDIDDDKLVNLTWYEVLSSLCQKLPQLHVIITKDRLTPLDVCQRILRFKNYFVAFVNKEILPPVLNVPFLGPMPYLPDGLKTYLGFLLFWGPWSDPYTLKEEYKRRQNIEQLTLEMQKSALILGCLSLLFMPFIFAYQLLYMCFSYIELVKRDPSAFGIRRYSNYGRNKLRHFNELDHELHIRLSRSHRAATQYMNLFVSPFVEIVAKNIKFIAGSIFAVFFILTAWDEDVLTLEHVLTVMTVTLLVIVVCNSFISSENRIYLPEQLMRVIISQIHYAPRTWEGKAHTQTVREEFDHLFPLTAQYIVEEIFSPLLTPLILIFWVRPRAKQFVEFFNRYTVSIEGLGDVCSFAQMDIKRHGDLHWNASVSPDMDVGASEAEKQEMAKDGKTELSLLHFAVMNPDWQPPPVSANFINDLRARVERDMATIGEVNDEDNLLLASINSIIECPLVAPSVAVSNIPRTDANRMSISRPFGLGVNRLDGPPSEPNSLLNSLQQMGLVRPRSSVPTSDETNLSGAAGEMALNTLYLRQLAGLNDTAEETTVPRMGQMSSRAFAESTSIWGVPAQDNMATESVSPGLFAHRVRAIQH